MILKTNNFKIELDKNGIVIALFYKNESITVEKAPFVYLLSSIDEKKTPLGVIEKNGVMSFDFGVCSVDISLALTKVPLTRF